MTYLGLDLGSGFAKLARCQPGGQVSSDGNRSPLITRVSAVVAYRGLGTAEIPDGYPDEPSPDVIRCDGFPAMLGTALSGRHVAAWRGRTPYEVTRDFLRCLLDQADTGRPDHPGSAAGPGGLVVAVPPEGRPRRGGDDASDPGFELPDLLTALGWPPRRLVTAPVAALLWLRERYPDLGAATRVAVIDIGAGSAELSLCTMAGRAARVIDSIRLVGPSAWDDHQAAAADRPPTIAEGLVTALASAAGARISPASRAPVYWWRAFESALADDGTRERLDIVLQLASEARHRHGSAPALRFGGLDVSASQLLDACEPLARRCVAALGQVLGRQDDPGWQRFGVGDGARLVLLGGLSVLHPVRAALLDSLGLDPGQPGAGVVRPDDDGLLGAVAGGAALLAAGLGDPGDRYPHGLQIAVNRVVRDRLVTEFLPLTGPGSIDLDQSRTVFLMDAKDGTARPLLVTVRPPAASPAGDLPISVRVVSSEGEITPAAFQPAAPPEAGHYWVGVRGGPDGPAVILHSAAGGEPLTYRLAEPAITVPDRREGQAGR